MGNLVLVEIIIWAVVSYLLGSVSFGYIVGKESGIDIRSKGSGSTGTTNALRTLGIKAALLTFLGDFFKAFIPCFIAGLLSVSLFGDTKEFSLVISMIAGLGAVLGHNFPFWMHFKGGKGIAVTAGVTVALSYTHWYYPLICVLLFVLIVILTKYVSVGSLCIPAWAVPVYAIIFERNNSYFVYLMVLGFVFTVLAFIMHAANVKRLLNGTENKLFGKDKKKTEE
ncbi:MAG: glycerol-3-phosphate 1-O-acyltransferase PlsY [Lachnospiraceae bacterium]|nr:glycerol-3-phosphate 1-O-acyltransferase PlsY [Lachnospiraceae bacterium]